MGGIMLFIKYLKEHRKKHYVFLIVSVLANLMAMNQKVYAFNLLFAFIYVFWYIILRSDMDLSMSDFCSKDIFKKGTSKEIHQMITGKLSPIDGEYIWHGRGLRLLFIVIEIMVYLRENKHCVITYGKIIKLINLKNLEALLNSDIPEHCRESLKEYISGLLPVGNELPVHEFIISRLRKIDGFDFS